MKKIITIIITILFLIVGLSGCTSTFGNNPKELVGTWKSRSGDHWWNQNVDTWILFSDGTADYDGSPAMWEVKDLKLVISFDVYNYSINGNVLTITEVTSGHSWIFDKQ